MTTQRGRSKNVATEGSLPSSVAPATHEGTEATVDDVLKANVLGTNTSEYSCRVCGTTRGYMREDPILGVAECYPSCGQDKPQALQPRPLAVPLQNTALRDYMPGDTPPA